jgi:CDP-glucose 4,6-dehydratase
VTGTEFWHDKTVLITGGLGLIGSRIARSVSAAGGRSIVADRGVDTRAGAVATNNRQESTLRAGNVSDYGWLAATVEEFQPEYVFHLAGQSTVEQCNQNPLSAFESNITGTWNLLEACRRNGSAKGVIIASSYKVYGHQNDACLAEDSPLLGLQPYDAAKVCADVLARSYYASFGLPVAVTRCANTYGEGDRHLSRIIPAAIHAALHDDELIITSDGRAERDYLYVGDAVTGYLAIAERFDTGEVQGQAFNLGSGTPVSVLDVVHAIGELLNTEVRYRILQAPRSSIDRLYLDIRKAKARLSWEPQSTLAEGLKRTIEWHQAAFRQERTGDPRTSA